MSALLEKPIPDNNTTEDSITEEAIKAPEMFFNVSSGHDSDVQRTPGLILTQQQIVNLKKYELVGLSLPIEIEAVIAYLGYSNGAGTGLEPDDFLKSFTLVHNHAKRWNPLRTQLLAVGSKLKVFAGQMLIYGDSMEEVYKDIKSGEVIEKFDIRNLEDVKRLQREQGDLFPGIELSPADKETARDIGFYLDEILRKVKESHDDALGIKEELDKFGLDLARYVAPEIQRKVVAIDNSSLPADVAKLTQDIERRAKDIDEKNKEYKAAVERSLGSISKFNVVGLALSIYFGVEAESVRKARNELINQQEKDINELQLKNKILGSLNRVKFDLQNLVTVVIDADVATKNLITVWNKLSIFIEESAKASSEITDALSLRIFMNRFRRVVEPWKTIQQDSDALLDVFKEADDEFKRIYGK
ncbi:alpha-xenorhabdolysin family binary toxin subunit A [Pseudomonas cichorii]|nr:alpha-xenorhabdolysin family binary toxin subunit A [Pseudomonas cichorii]